MLRLNRKTEYALMAIQHLAALPAGDHASTSEIARRYQIPDMLLAKVLQRLKRHGLLRSTKGAAGGYALARDPREINFLDFLAIFEEQTTLVDCSGAGGPSCSLVDVCEIRSPVLALDALLQRQLRHLTLHDVLAFEGDA